MSQTLPITEHDEPDSIQQKLGKIVVWVAAGLIILFLLMGLSQAFVTQYDLEKAPEFSIATYDDITYTLSELEGQVVVINFWASWCVPCRDEAADLERTWLEYQDQDVIFIGIGYLDSDVKARSFIDEFGITYPNGPDLGTRISDAYRIKGVPETFVIDANGDISFFIEAPTTYNELSREIEKALRRSEDS